MAFFDKLGETISTKSKDVAKKAKDFANISKLNSQIASEEDTVNTTFQSIGQEYFITNQDDVTSAYTDRFKVIMDAKKRIENLRKDIQDIKGTRKCTNCGGEVPVNMVFCSSCGSKVEDIPVQKEEQAATKTCLKCGTEIDENVAFCTNCGAQIEQLTDEE